jgi:hypothetical protein
LLRPLLDNCTECERSWLSGSGLGNDEDSAKTMHGDFGLLLDEGGEAQAFGTCKRAGDLTAARSDAPEASSSSLHAAFGIRVALEQGSGSRTSDKASCSCRGCRLLDRCATSANFTTMAFSQGGLSVTSNKAVRPLRLDPANRNHIKLTCMSHRHYPADFHQ